jgi:flagellar biosynthesis protein FlhF
MRLKSFYAKTMTEAMHMVREALGEDAIIIATREENGGKAVRVTAAIDHEFAPAPPPKSSAAPDPSFEIGKLIAQRDDWLQYDDEESDDDRVSEAVIDIMLKHAVPEDVMDQIISCVSVMGLEDPAVALVGAYDTLFTFAPLPQKAHKKALMFVGPPGAGKTLTAAKQAARLVLNGQKVAVITCDTVRAGGIEQLQAFTRLLKTDLLKAKNAIDLAMHIKSLSGKVDQIIIDTAGSNPFDAKDMKDLASLMASGDIEPILVLPAAMDATECGEMARIFAAIGVRRFIPSRVDIARRLGGLLAAAHAGALSFADVSNTAKVADGLAPLTPSLLASFFLPKSSSSPQNDVGSKKSASDAAKSTLAKRKTRKTG